MSILFIGKRFNTNRDSFSERFGRIYQLPYHWAVAGRNVDLWLIDYHRQGEDRREDDQLSVQTTPVTSWRFISRAFGTLISGRRYERPDVVVGSGDCYIGMLALFLARFCRARFIFDVYDRYDTFDGYRKLPGFDPLSYLIKRSDLTLFASQTVLREFESISRQSLLVPNGVDLTRFATRPKHQARQQFDLPGDIPLIGYFGSMEPERGIEDLIAAVAKLIGAGTEIGLVVGGKASSQVGFDYPWLNYLGNLPFSDMPAALASCDLLALPYRSSKFLDNASSCKIAEYIAARRPIVATRSPNLTRNFPGQAAQLDDLLAQSGNAEDIARCIKEQLLQRRLVDMPDGMDWRAISECVLAAIDADLSNRVVR